MDTRYLERHGRRWRVTVPVPKKLQPTVGKKRLKRTLGTDSLATANYLKWGIVADLKREMARLARATPDDKIIEQALIMRGGDPEHIDIHAESIVGEPTDYDEDERPVYDPRRARDARLFRAVATGQETPLRAFVGAWHAQEITAKSVQRAMIGGRWATWRRGPSRAEPGQHSRPLRGKLRVTLSGASWPWRRPRPRHRQ
jgi:hypothetical protein